ncbi:MAG: alcohol dehydrogenase catalytic domain-containing protein, partial [Chloroflexi bacterium]|nr:alcohol dehydrogenase catalytic domain-containing protein [Chloroflexota bacterium]
MPIGKVAVFTASGVPFEIEELPTPEIESGGILVKNTHAVICGSDLHGWRGGGDVPIPPVRRLTGHEFTG